MTRCAPLLALLLVLLVVAELSSAEFNFDECSKSKHCVTSPSGCRDETTCEYAFSYARDGTSDNALIMELFTKRGNEGKVSYVAVGFSTDQFMGDEGVTACTTDGDKVEVHLSWNDADKSNKPGGKDNGTAEIRDFKLTHDTLYCKFVQHSHAGSNELTRPDLGKQPYHLLLARGQSRGGMLGAHSFTAGPNFPLASPSAVELFAAPTAAVGNPNPQNADDPPSGPFGLRVSSKLTLVKFHGFLMTVAWLGFVAMAVYTARFMKDVWSNTNLCGVKLWFSLHRSFNIAAVVLMVVSAICVLLARDLRWTGPWFSRSMDENLSVGKIHSLVGAVSVILAISQPLNSLLRCTPSHPKRYQFNVAHRTIGLAGFALALVALLIAAWRFLKYWSSPTLALVLLILFVIVATSLVIVSDINRSRLSREKVIAAMELNGRNKSPNAPSTPSDTYYFRAQNTNRSGRFSSNTRVLYMLAAGVCSLTCILYAILIWGH